MSYIKPLETERPACRDRFDAFSPKLGRPLTLFSYSQFNNGFCCKPCLR